MTMPTKRDLRYVSIEPGRISLHGVALTDGEYAVLRGIAERMKQLPPTEIFEKSFADLQAVVRRDAC